MIAFLFYSTMSGIILSFFYDPAPEKAYESMQSIVGIPLLAFTRNFHYWSGDLLLFVLFLHVTRVALTKPVGSARRYAWWFGTGLLFLVGAEMLIGTFLRGDQEAYEAYSHFFVGTNAIVANYFPAITILTDFFSQNSALFRFFILHTVLLPLGIVFLIIAHGLFAPTFRAMLMPWRKVSDSALRGKIVGAKELFTYSSVRKIVILSAFSFIIISILSVAVPAPLYPSPFVGLEVTKPPWWLLWIVALENIWGLTAILLAPPALFLIFAIIPFFTKDRAGADLGVYIYLTALAVVVLLSFWAANAPQVAHTEHYNQAAGSAH